MKITKNTFKVIFLIIFYLFSFRVLAQFIQKFWNVTFLPPFEAWQNGTIPYWLLFIFQILIIIFFLGIITNIKQNNLILKKKRGIIFISLGLIYLFIMIFRLITGLTFAQGHPWFDALLPTLFHFILSSFVILFGIFNYKYAQLILKDSIISKNNKSSLISYFAYPVIMLLILCFYQVLKNTTQSIQIATYISIIVGAFIITILEHKFPNRQEWLPNSSEVKNDVTFLVFIQIILPKLLSFFFAITLLKFFHNNDIILSKFWPHSSPIIIQVILMLVAAEFLRYWLHRAAHEWLTPLWRLHAVHHSPKKLYWTNVGRFHPIEKALQFLLDSLPFIILGVTKEVIAVYFVFYSINGFFQHCNIHLKLGILNYIISGPELHRWHHSFVIREANKNYGNNLIIWDLLFGTWFLPKDKEVEKLGLINRNYPSDFIHQMQSPFIKGLDKSIQKKLNE